MTTASLPPTSRSVARHEVDALVTALRAEIHQARDWGATASGVCELLRDHLPPATILTAAEREGSADQAVGHRLHVEPDGSFSLLAIVWRHAQWTRAHDHVTWCVFASIQGQIEEQRFQVDPTAETLTLVARRPCPTGAIRCEVPPGDIHRLGNPHTKPAITLHIYGTDVTRLGSSARSRYALPVVGRKEG